MSTSVLYRIPATRIALLAMVGLVVVTAITLIQARRAEAAFPGNNGKIAFVSGVDIYTMNPDGSGQQRLTHLGGGNFHPSFSPDGQKIAYVRGVRESSEIYVMNADGSGQRRLTHDSVRNDAPGWSPDGGKILFSSGWDHDIYAMNPDGSDKEMLINDFKYHDEPAWSPDGTRIAYGRHRGIYVANADGSGERRLIGSGPNPGRYHPSWSPDGTQIAFLEETSGGTKQIRVMNADGSGNRGITRLYTTREFIGEPAWSPDGKKIAYSFSSAICVVTLATASQSCASDSSASRRMPDWQPLHVYSPPPAVTYCSISDCIKPTISNLRPSPGSSTRDRTPTIRATVSDDRTNLAKEDIKLFVDGRSRTTFSYDRSTDRLRYVSGRLSYGWHTVRVEAEDVYNNVATESWRIRVRR